MKIKAKQDHAEPQERPTHHTTPIYGPPTEEDYLRAVKDEAEQHLAAAYDKYKAAKDALPPEPSKKEAMFAFTCWVQANHRAAYDYQQKYPSWDERQEHQRKVIEPLFETWAASEEGRHIGAPRLAWEKAKAAIEANYKAERAPHEAAIEDARKRWNEIQQVKERRRVDGLKIARRKSVLFEAIGYQLCRDINLDHPDFDRATYEKYIAWDSWDNAIDGQRNAIITGAPRLGKTRAMAAYALNYVQPDEDDYNKIEWITAAKFADLVTSLGNNEERDAARKHLRRLADADILFFDDLGSVHFTDARVSHFMALIDARYQPGNPTHFTTNFTLQQIREMLSGKGSSADVMLADRILGRIIGTEAEPRAEVFEFKRRNRSAAKGRR